MFKNMLLGILNLVWKLLKWPLFISIIFLFVLILAYVSYYIYLVKYVGIKRKPNNGDHIAIKEENIFVKLWLAIKQMVRDKLDKDPAQYEPKGARIICFVGTQGKGKTISMARTLIREQSEWPKLRVATNFGYEFEDEKIEKWEDIIDLDNEKHGYIVALDECQLWANNRDWKNFDINMLQEICYQRKQNKVLMLSSQVFGSLDKNFRTQTQEIHYCRTFFKVFTVVCVKEPTFDYSTGDIKEQKFLRMYCFPHTPELRSSYDTYKMIDHLRKVGFVDRSEQLGNATENNNINIVETKKKK